jgi:hypothetical protein
MSPAVLTRRCNPYGHETGGPKHLTGGLYGPEYEGQHKWVCENPVTHRVRMHCKLYGHSGPVMELCDAHHAEIQKRQAGLCTRCAFPPEARACQDMIESAQRDLQELLSQGWHWQDPKCSGKREIIERGRVRMNELWVSGRIKRVPMTLVEIS